jgi:ferredoxin
METRYLKPFHRYIMALYITDACINCGACLDECPNHAIYEPAEKWNFADGTSLTQVETEQGELLEAHQQQEPLSDFIYYIVPEKCTECQGFEDEPQCQMVCPVACCLPDPNYPETEEDLLLKKEWLHA